MMSHYIYIQIYACVYMYMEIYIYIDGTFSSMF